MNQYDELLLTLENDREFYEAYCEGLSCAAGTAEQREAARRSLIRRHARRLKVFFAAMEGWESGQPCDQARLYFDERWGEPKPEQAPKAAIPEGATHVGTKSGRFFKRDAVWVAGAAAWQYCPTALDDRSCYTPLNPPRVAAANPCLGATYHEPTTFTNDESCTITGSFNATGDLTFTITKEPETMNTNTAIEITTKTLINGVDISTLNDSAIYDLIAQQEAKIAELDKIQNKPKKLVAEIGKRQAGIDALVAHLDSKAD